MKKNITRIVVGIATLSAVAAFALPTTIGKDVTPSGDLQLQGTTKNLENVFAIDATAKAKSNTQKAKVNGLALSAEMTAAEKKQIRDMYEGPSRVRANAADVTLPYENTFSAATDLEGWTIIDGNGDGKKWTRVSNNGGAVRMTYNASKAMDDWLITPEVPVEAGKFYDFSMEAYSYSASYPERVEVCWGDEPTAAAMTNVIVEPTTVACDYAARVTLTGTIAATATGNIYVGIHGISDKDQWYLYVDEVKISVPVATDIPAAPTNVTFTPKATDPHTVTIAFDVPTTTLAGDPTTITEAKIMDDGTAIKTWANPTDARLSYDYTVAEGADVEFSIVCSNAEGEGKIYSETVYIGVNLAAAPINCQVTEWASTPGKVTITWEPVAKDFYGNDLDLSFITYTLLDQDSEIIAEDIPASTPEFDYQAVPEGEQDFVYFFIVPITEKGANVNAGGYGSTDMIACGTPYDMPFVEGITASGLEHILGVNYTKTVYSSPQQLKIVSSCTNPSAQPMGNDGAMLAWWPYATEEMQLYTGKIHVDESEFAAFSFYYHSTTDEYYTLKPYVMLAGYTYYLLEDGEAISTKKADDDESLEWKRVILPLVDYLGQDVQVGIEITCISDAQYCLIDQLEVIDIFQNDLGVVSIAAPRGVETGDEATITAGIQNLGSQETAPATAQLLCNGEVVDTQDVPALAPNAIASVTFTVTYDPFADPQYSYQVKIVNDGDQNEDNNLSDNISIIVSQPMLNEVTDLAAEFANEAINLTWSAPEAMPTPDPTVTEDFENAATYTEVVDGWTIIDGDGATVGNVSAETFPSGTRGWIVTDQNLFLDSSGNVQSVWTAHSGNNFMCTMYNQNGSKNDDWLITPELSGDAQTISLWADIINAQYAETMQLLYSETDTDPSSFTLIEQYTISTLGWTEYTADVPAGAKYFAIHYASQDKFLIKIDDVTYTGVTKAAPVVESYNVYRNEEKIAEGLTETSYTDDDWMFDTEYTYYVTAVYSNGKESPLSNPAEVTTPPVTIEDLNALTDFPAETNFIMDGALTVIYCDAEAGIAIVTDGVSNASMSVESTEYQAGDVLATGWQGIYSEGLVMILPLEDPEVASSAAAIEPVECDAEDIATQQAKNFNYVTVNYLTIDAEAIEEAAETDNLSIVAYALDTPVLMVNLFAIDLPMYAGTYSVTGFFAENPETIAQMDGQSTKQYIFIPVEFVEHFETVESLSALADFPEMTRFIMGCPLTVIYSNELGAVVTDGESNAFFHNDTNYAEGNVLETGWHAVFYGEGLLGIGCVDEENPGTTGTAEVAAPADCMPEDIAVMQAKDLNYVKLLYVEIDEEAVAEAEENDGMFMLAQAGETPVLIVNYFDAELPTKAGIFEITGFWAINAESPIAPAAEGELSKQYIFVPVSFLETDAIAGIEAVNDNAVYYDLKGIQITNPQSGKVYIRAIDGKVAKVIVK